MINIDSALISIDEEGLCFKSIELVKNNTKVSFINFYKHDLIFSNGFEDLILLANDLCKKIKQEKNIDVICFVDHDAHEREISHGNNIDPNNNHIHLIKDGGFDPEDICRIIELASQGKVNYDLATEKMSVVECEYTHRTPSDDSQLLFPSIPSSTNGSKRTTPDQSPIGSPKRVRTSSAESNSPLAAAPFARLQIPHLHALDIAPENKGVISNSPELL